MKLSVQREYNLIFFNAIQYDSINKIAAYFLGKFNEVKECNPLELYVDGLQKAFSSFENFFKDLHQKELKNYYQLKQFNPEEEYERPDINDNYALCAAVNPKFRGHYCYADILRINKGLERFRNNLPKSKKKQNDHIA